jgi:hypothetical protein
VLKNQRSDRAARRALRQGKSQNKM